MPHRRDQFGSVCSLPTGATPLNIGTPTLICSNMLIQPIDVIMTEMAWWPGDKTSGSSSSRHHDLHRHMYNWMGRVCSEVDVDPQKRLLHINLLEMTADCLALQSLELRPCLNILVSTVNTSVVAYVNHQGGTSLVFLKGNHNVILTSLEILN